MILIFWREARQCGILGRMAETKKGSFIVVDGGDGAGKDTQIARIKNFFCGPVDILFTREPGGTAIGKQLRKVLLSSENTALSPETELLLFSAARAQFMKEIVIPALKAGRNVVTNRFDSSTAAYQIYGRQRNYLHPLFTSINALALTDAETGTIYRPDLYILLDVLPKTGIIRKRNIPEEELRFEREPMDFHERVRVGFRAFLEREHKERHAVIDANRDASAVWRDVKVCLAPFFL